MANTIIILNCLFLPRTSDERKVLTKYSITMLKISNDETVDQLRIMIRERWPSLFEKTPPADFILCEIDNTGEDTSIDKQINEYALGRRQNEIGMASYELISRYFFLLLRIINLYFNKFYREIIFQFFKLYSN